MNSEPSTTSETMAVPNTVVFYGYNTAGGENAIFQNFQKGGDGAPLADVLTHTPFAPS